MEEKLQFKYIVLYMLFLTIQLTIFSPKTVIGINIPILYVYLFNLLDNQHIEAFKQRIKFDTTFIAVLLMLSSVILVLTDYVFWGTSLMLSTIAIFWKK